MGKFFSFSGRIGRYEYWVWSFGLVGLLLLATMVTGLMGLAVSWLLLFPAFWFGNLSLAVRRWHDRNKSGVWVLLPFIPVIGAIWAFIELGFIEGTPGPNNYGWPYGTAPASHPAGMTPMTQGVPYGTVMFPMPVQISVAPAMQPAASGPSTICASCGDANEQDNRFCKRCGSRLQGPDIQPGEAWNPARI
jgi:uncharacterized membrane protein YhaH (DUF805 family)